MNRNLRNKIFKHVLKLKATPDAVDHNDSEALLKYVEQEFDLFSIWSAIQENISQIIQNKSERHPTSLGQCLKAACCKSNALHDEPNFAFDHRCELVENQAEGRFFRSTGHIESNTIIAQEKAFAVALTPDSMLSKCLNCFENISNMGIACEGCNEVMFCNEQCAETSWHNGHRFECGLLNFMVEACYGKTLVFRLMCRLGVKSIFDWDHGERFYSSWSEYMTDEIQQSLPENQKTCNQKLQGYMMLNNLENHGNKFVLKHSAWHIVDAIEIAIVACIRQRLSKFVSSYNQSLKHFPTRRHRRFAS